MDHQQKCIRIGALAIGCALLLRFLSISGVSLSSSREELLSAVLLLGTGRVLKQAEMPVPTPPATQPLTEPTAPIAQRTPLQFTQADASLVTLRNTSGYAVDIPTLITRPLALQLSEEEPAVLILHTHGSESYTKTEDYAEATAYRTLDSRYNVVSIGTYLTQLLEQNGIRVIHDQALHDQPSYNGSYADARTSIAAYLQRYPSIQLVLDLHRDAAVDASGDQLRSTVQTPEGNAAQLMLVMGTDAGGLEHDEWEQNLSLALKLHATLERQTPGLCRDLQLRTSRFNQDLSPGALLIEVGAAGNTRQEALLSTQLLSQAIVSLVKGT